jgi:hypothetical protein
MAAKGGWHLSAKGASHLLRLFSSEEVVMGDDLVVLWRDREAAHDICYEIRQIAEGEFELRILCDGRVWMTEEAVDFNDLVARATQLRRDLHPVA